MRYRCPHCDHASEFLSSGASDTQGLEDFTCPACGRSTRPSGLEETRTAPRMEDERIGKFKVLELLGEGSFGYVFKALDTELQRLVAIKIPRAELGSAGSQARHLREAQAAAQVRHPNVVSVLEVGTHKGYVYIACDFVNGVTLKQWQTSRAIPLREAVQLMVKIARAVQAAHDSRVIHRDLKPANILIDVDGEPFVTDFGLAKWSSSPDETMTHEGQILGTLAYMSPEQAAGQVQSISNCSDIYALGVILYELITGQRPFSGTRDSRNYLYKIQAVEPAAPRKLAPAIPKDVETICLKAMRKEPGKRYASAAELAADLERFLEGKPIAARPVSRPERGLMWIKRNPLVAALASLAVLLLLIAVLAWLRPPAVIPPAPGKHRVTVSLRAGTPAASTARWALVPLDERRMPIASRKVTARGAKVAAELEPGSYLVVASVPGVGFHEVYRSVPVDAGSTPGHFAHTQWAVLEDGTIRWSDVPIVTDNDVLDSLINIPGGDFVMGLPGDIISPRHSRHTDGFQVAPTETTFTQFTQYGPRPRVYSTASMPEGDHPVVGVSWNLAVAYAEAVGCRLLTEFEYEYAATNGGLTRFPWGDDPALIQPWQLTPVTAPTKDQSELGVYNLLSNAAEWTDSVLVPYPGAAMQLPEEIVQRAQNSRIYRGGPASITSAQPAEMWHDGVSRRAALETHNTGNHLGFRVGRSTAPRFIEP